MESIGLKLKNKRIEKNLTLNDVYEKTKIHPRVLAALEEDRAQEKLNDFYIKNFLRNYAGFLSLDAKAIVEDYFSCQSRSLVNSFKRPKTSKLLDPKKLSLQVTAGLFIFISIILTFIHFGHKESSSYPKGKKTAALNLPETAKQKNLFPEINSAEKLKLLLKSNKDVWIQVKSDEKIVFKDTLKKGAAANWTADKSFELWITDGKALELELNGQILACLRKGSIKNIIIDREGINAGGR